MKKKIITVFILTILISTIVLPASGHNNPEKTNLVSFQNETHYSHKVSLMGIIKDMNDGKITSFTTACVFSILQFDFNGTRSYWTWISRNAQMEFPMKLYEFRGILRKHFVWGVFNFPQITVSPASINHAEPAEINITVARDDLGIPDVWVGIEIPGISGEMNSTTDENGKAIFVFTPPTTGNIIINIENNTIPLTVNVTA